VSVGWFTTAIRILGVYSGVQEGVAPAGWKTGSGPVTGVKPLRWQGKGGGL
jgi:hypothetical protein